jgi:hypothetical protein
MPTPRRHHTTESNSFLKFGYPILRKRFYDLRHLVAGEAPNSAIRENQETWDAYRRYTPQITAWSGGIASQYVNGKTGQPDWRLSDKRRL